MLDHLNLYEHKKKIFIIKKNIKNIDYYYSHKYATITIIVFC